MNADLKARWIAALRSGEFKQAFGELQKNDGYCCLGVLCKVAGRTPTNSADDTTLYDWMRLELGLPTAGLWHRNDQQKLSFPEIADWIEVNL